MMGRLTGGWGRGRDKEAGEHPTVFPSAMLNRSTWFWQWHSRGVCGEGLAPGYKL